MHIDEIIKKSRAGDVLSREELIYLLTLSPDSAETYMVMAEVKPLVAANLFFRKVTGTSGAVHHATTMASDRRNIEQG